MLIESQTLTNKSECNMVDLEVVDPEEGTQINQMPLTLQTTSLAKNPKSSQGITLKLMSSSPSGTYLLVLISTTQL